MFVKLLVKEDEEANDGQEEGRQVGRPELARLEELLVFIELIDFDVEPIIIALVAVLNELRL